MSASTWPTRKIPQPGQDEEGNLIEQDPHPILSEHAVRLAMAHALDYQSIIDNVYLGQGYPIASNVLPAVDWAYDPSIEPYAYDPELSAQILDEAGWVDSDGDGVRDRDGQTLSLSLMTNAGNTTREDMGVLVQDQLNALGFDITFEAIDFGTLVDQLLGQTFDMVIIGWTGLGTDPNDESFWHTENDVPGSSFNFVSFQNERVNELLKEGVSIPGCAPEDRAPVLSGNPADHPRRDPLSLRERHDRQCRLQRRLGRYRSGRMELRVEYPHLV